MFLNSGNGVVFRGALGPWHSEKSREFHLRREPAKDLVAEVIKAYTKDHGGPPAELFIHGRQRFKDEEWEGFGSAVPPETKLVGVRIRPTQDLRLFRPDTDMAPRHRRHDVAEGGLPVDDGLCAAHSHLSGIRNAQAAFGRDESR
jgi:hypothetical protein